MLITIHYKSAVYFLNPYSFLQSSKKSIPKNMKQFSILAFVLLSTLSLTQAAAIDEPTARTCWPLVGGTIRLWDSNGENLFQDTSNFQCRSVNTVAPYFQAQTLYYADSCVVYSGQSCSGNQFDVGGYSRVQTPFQILSFRCSCRTQLPL